MVPRNRSGVRPLRVWVVRRERARKLLRDAARPRQRERERVSEGETEQEGDFQAEPPLPEAAAVVVLLSVWTQKRFPFFFLFLFFPSLKASNNSTCPNFGSGCATPRGWTVRPQRPSNTEQATMPVERMRMRPWLEEQINSCQIPGLKWVNKEKRIFQIPWMHAARHGWDLEKDAPLFMRWAIHTGKYQPGVDRPDPKTWKANFRCAMNSLPDIEEVKDKSIKKGTNAFRVYKMLSSTERSLKKGKKKTDKEGKPRGNKEAAPPSPDRTLVEANAGPIDYTKQEIIKQEALELTVADSAPAIHSSVEDHVITSEQLPFVCQTIEVTTENEEQTVSSSHSYPLQISPVSSCCDSDTDSDTEDIKEPGFGPYKRSNNYNTSVLRIPSCSLPGMATFVSPSKPNFRVTSTRDPTPLISYTDNWTPAYSQNSIGSTAASHTHEMRASVIMKTSDVTSS
ncbi:interferon regulatory factor 2 isoform X2 [Mugil cephalus]|uniref:interferon regulatory factor 2 isoform X2 n=1 Tax=Mugil cephalus TaxID=48193 RepID=UPI001FB830D8|nr:interferon regulatory factor 2 isoform X2 [Mugil cephalus]